MVLIAKTFLFAAMALFPACLASRDKSRSQLSRMPTDDDRTSLSRTRKRDQEGESRYLEQCRPVNMWEEQLGYVSVLAFLDPSWHYSFRQAVMLKLLSARLQRSGFPDVRFYVIAPPPDQPQDKLEDELEIQTWREIPMYESVDPARGADDDDDDDDDDESKLIFVQDDSQTRVWEKFRASKDQVVVVDRCGKLTYQVMVPWSILYFPYVKAAILSTYEEDPCGACDLAVHKESSRKDSTSSRTNAGKTGRIGESETRPDATRGRVDADRVAPGSSTVPIDESSDEEELVVASAASSVPVADDETAIGTTVTSDLSRATESSSESADDDAIGRTSETERVDVDRLAPGSSAAPIDESSDEEEASAGSSVPVVDDETAIGTTVRPDLPRATESSSESADDDATESTVRSTDPSTEWDREQSTVSVTEDTVSGPDGSTLPPPTTNDSSYENAKDDRAQLDESADESDPSTVTTETSLYEESSTAYKPSDDSTNGNSTVRANPLPLPLRIILHAPHTHRDSWKTRKHSHLILKIDSPDYHGHLDSDADVVAPSTNTSEGVPVTDSEERNLKEIEVDANEEASNRKFTYDKDESPGLYGEVADYWRNLEDSDITDRNETSNDNYNKSMINHNEENRSNISDAAVNSSKPSEGNEDYLRPNVSTDEYIKDSIDNSQDIVSSNQSESSEAIDTNDQVDKDEEMRNKLIEHYSKLLPWIYYILNK